jgi:phage baseplate assembly protein W
MTYPSGIAYPFKIREAGGVSTVDGDKKVKTNIISLFKTSRRERVFRKTVGLVGYGEVFRNHHPDGDLILLPVFKEAIRRHEPRATNLQMSIDRKEDNEGNHLYLKLRFVFKDLGNPSNILLRIE